VGHLSVRCLRLGYGARTLLAGLEFDVHSGELVALVGPNGVGKTTLLRALAGLVRPQEGQIALGGVPLQQLSPHQRARELSLVAADGELPLAMTARELVLSGRYPHRAWWDWTRGQRDLLAVDSAMRRVGLLPLAERPFETLSAGERQRAWIALAIAQEAGVVLLDEPTSHLDPRYAVEVLALLRRLAADGTSVVVILHDLNEAAAVADRVAVLGEGTLLAFEKPEGAFEPQILERAFGVAFDRIAVDDSVRVLPREPSVSRTPPPFATEL
jgi:iron complex transport system ATP-binding protein